MVQLHFRDLRTNTHSSKCGDPLIPLCKSLVNDVMCFNSEVAKEVADIWKMSFKAIWDWLEHFECSEWQVHLRPLLNTWFRLCRILRFSRQACQTWHKHSAHDLQQHSTFTWLRFPILHHPLTTQASDFIIDNSCSTPIHVPNFEYVFTTLQIFFFIVLRYVAHLYKNTLYNSNSNHPVPLLCPPCALSCAPLKKHPHSEAHCALLYPHSHLLLNSCAHSLSWSGCCWLNWPPPSHSAFELAELACLSWFLELEPLPPAIVTRLYLSA